MRKLKTILLIFIALFLLLQIDDELDPEVKQWVEAINEKISQTENDAYFYLMGMGAAENADPYKIGKKVVVEGRKQERLFFDEGVEPDFGYDDEATRLEIPEGSLFCQIQSAECFSYMLEHESEIQESLDNHNVLFQRYQYFMRLGNYSAVSMPYIFMILPHYQYLTSGNRLLHLLVMQRISEGDESVAFELLVDDIKNNRKKLAEADDLLGKMIYVANLNRDFQLLNLLIKHGLIEAKISVDFLTASEKNFKKAAISEFGFIVDYTVNFQKHAEKGSYLRVIPSWLLTPIFKENMTINEGVIRYKEIAEMSVKSASELALAIQEANKDVSPYFLFDINYRNIEGSILNRMADIDLNEYVARVFDLDCKIKLLNLLSKYKDENGGLELEDLPADVDISNPYYPDEGPYYDEEKGVLCYSGPYEDTKNVRCIFN